MGAAKLRVSLAGMTFAGEGDSDWLSEQFDKLLDKAGELPSADGLPDDGPSADGPNSGGGEEGFTQSLASYIREHAGDGNQVQRFLVTADWLRRRGAAELTTTAVSTALRDNHQKKLTNPSDCLRQNITKGYCEKDGDRTFFIAPDGLAVLGRNS